MGELVPAQELRKAAERIREVAGKATPGPWGVGNGTTVDVDRECWNDDESRYVEVDPEDDAEHVALFDPIVAELVAALLDKEAQVGNTGAALALARAINGGAA